MVQKVAEKMQHPGWASIIVVLLTLVLGFSEWGTASEIEQFVEIFEIQNLFSLFKYLSPVGIAAITRGFIK